ncbi:hypothetical protein ACFB49_42920 [Sphingomonas sp. DBB INV C78]
MKAKRTVNRRTFDQVRAETVVEIADFIETHADKVEQRHGRSEATILVRAMATTIRGGLPLPSKRKTA